MSKTCLKTAPHTPSTDPRVDPGSGTARNPDGVDLERDLLLGFDKQPDCPDGGELVFADAGPVGPSTVAADLAAALATMPLDPQTANQVPGVRPRHALDGLIDAGIASADAAVLAARFRQPDSLFTPLLDALDALAVDTARQNPFVRDPHHAGPRAVDEAFARSFRIEQFTPPEGLLDDAVLCAEAELVKNGLELPDDWCTTLLGGDVPGECVGDPPALTARKLRFRCASQRVDSALLDGLLRVHARAAVDGVPVPDVRGYFHLFTEDNRSHRTPKPFFQFDLADVPFQSLLAVFVPNRNLRTEVSGAAVRALELGLQMIEAKANKAVADSKAALANGAEGQSADAQAANAAIAMLLDSPTGMRTVLAETRRRLATQTLASLLGGLEGLGLKNSFYFLGATFARSSSGFPTTRFQYGGPARRRNQSGLLTADMPSAISRQRFIRDNDWPAYDFDQKIVLEPVLEAN